MTFYPSSVSNVILIISAFSAAFIIALWISSIIWVNRDSRSRSRDPLLIFFSVFFVTVFFLPGILIYLILRPGNTLEEEYQKTLEEELLLRSIEDHHSCPGCGHRTNMDWAVCPFCQTPLKNTCTSCKRKLETSWKLCPYCGTQTTIVDTKKIEFSTDLQSPYEGKQEDQDLPDLTFDL